MGIHYPANPIQNLGENKESTLGFFKRGDSIENADILKIIKRTVLSNVKEDETNDTIIRILRNGAEELEKRIVGGVFYQLLIPKDVINNKVKNNILDFKRHKDNKGYEFTVIKEKSKLYDWQPWFYPNAYDVGENKFSIYPYEFYDLSTATLIALYHCGSVNSYIVTRDIKLLFVNKIFVKKVINDIIDPLLKGKTNKHKDYYRYVKMYLKKEYNLASSGDTKKIEMIKSTEVKGDSWTKYFLSYVSKELGYNGLLFLNNTGLYSIIDNSTRIILNRKKLFVRNTENKYDWNNWGLESYILPIDIFDLNIKYYLYKNTGFKVYDFLQRKFTNKYKNYRRV